MKWDKEWFQELEPKHKCFWMYLCDKCNHAGIWDANIKLAEFVIKAKFDRQELLSLFARHIYEMPSTDKWFVVDYIEFQYGELSEESQPHRSVIALLKKEGLWDIYPTLRQGLPNPLPRDKDKDKDIDKAKDKDLTDKKEKHLEFVYLTPKQHESLIKQFGDTGAATWIAKVNTYAHKIGERKFKSKYSSHFHVIMEWYDRDVKSGKITETKPEVNNEEITRREEERVKKLIEAKK